MNKWKIGEHKKFMVFCYWLQNAIPILKHRISTSAQYMMLGKYGMDENGERKKTTARKEIDMYLLY